MDNRTYVNVKKRKKLIKEIRKELGLSQAEAASLLGIDRANLSKFETGAEIPDWVIKAMKLNSFLKRAGYTLDDLRLFPPRFPNDN